MDTKLVLAKNPNMVTRRIDEEIILLPILKSTEDINSIYSLNASAARVWELINGKRTMGEIVTLVTGEFEVTETKAIALMEELVRELHQIKALAPAKAKAKAKAKAASRDRNIPVSKKNSRRGRA